MISTATTSVTSVTTTVFAGSFGLLVTLTLLTLLIQKELTSVAQGQRWLRVNRALRIAIVPLLLTFLLITLVEVMSVL